jgi:hypothetical protein
VAIAIRCRDERRIADNKRPIATHPAWSFSAVDLFQVGREPLPLLVIEISVPRASGDDERVILNPAVGGFRVNGHPPLVDKPPVVFFRK